MLAASLLCALDLSPRTLAQARVRHRAPQVQSAAPLVVQKIVPLVIDESQTVTLSGNTHPLAEAASDQGQIASSTALQGMILTLAPTAAQESALDALLAAQRNSSSSQYHRWLTPAEFGARFGASVTTRSQVSAWLTSHGFVVNEVAASGRYLVFSGNETQLEDTFHTVLHHYTVGGEAHLANAQDPQIPAALASRIAGLVSLHDFRSASTLASRTPIGSAATQSTTGVHALYSAGATHYLFPADFATLYNVGALHSAGLSGAGVVIAIAGRSNIKTNDVTSFRSLAGLSVNTPTVIFPGADPGVTSNDRDEATLDVEWAGAVAPSASVMLVASPSTATTDGIDIASAYIVNHALGSIISVSYANCESAMGSTELAFYNSLWRQAAAQGQTVLVASGDAGAAGCQAGAATRGTSNAVNGICSSPYATCVGGTQFNEGSNAAFYWASSNTSAYGSALSYIPETVWNESASNGGTGLWASGGGASRTYAQPDWQAAVSGAAASNGMRAVPDISLNAAAHDGSMIVEDGTPFVVSGTSVAAPALAGILALAVQSSGAGLGSVNSRLYTLAVSTPSAFHPTSAGNNTVPGVAGFTAAGATYNLATGLGSVDAAVLVRNWTEAVTTAPDFTLSASTSAATIAAGSSAAFTLSVAGSTGSTVTLSATVPSGISVSFGSASVSAGASTTVTVSVASSALSGEQQIVVTGADASGTQSVSYTLTVTGGATALCPTALHRSGSTCSLSVPVNLRIVTDQF